MLLLGAGIAASLFKPWPLALIIDQIAGGKPAPASVLDWLPFSGPGTSPSALLTLAALAIFVLHLVQGLCAAGQNILAIQAGLGGLARVRTELFDHMQRLSLAFYQRRNQGDLIYRATWDTYSLQTIFQQGLFKFVSSLATVLLMVGVMWRVHPGLTLMTLAIFPPLLAAMFFFGKRMNRRGLEAHQADGKVASLVQQNLSSLPLVQSYAREEEESRAFSSQVRASRQKREGQHRVEVLYWFVIALLFGLATAALAWSGGREILQGNLTVGQLVIFLAYLGQLYEPLNQLSHVGATVSDANAGAERIFEILDARESVPSPLQPVAFPAQAGRGLEIELDQVQFGYDPNQPVLRNLSLRVGAGEAIGLIGPSGAGKTTLLNLLPRFFDADRGTIRIGGVETRQYALGGLRRHIACVFQETFLLPGTIAENIAYARPGASDQEIQAAAGLANAREFIERLPQGYRTVVGEGGARLSVGEKQRINLARAFLKNAPILLLDEPTSSLDAETESSVIESLSRLLPGRTTLMAAHRLGTLRHAHRLVVLEGGAITEMGSPAELIESGGYYARLARA